MSNPSPLSAARPPVLVAGSLGAASGTFVQLLDRHEQRLPAGLVRSILAGERVLITGGAGTIGSELARLAVENGAAEVIVVDRDENDLVRLGWDLPDARLILHDCSRATMFDIIEIIKPTMIFHAAAYKHVSMAEQFRDEAWMANVVTTEVVLAAAYTAHVRRVCLISSDKAAAPVCTLGKTKRVAEWSLHMRRNHGEKAAYWRAVRLVNVLGSSGSVLERWERSLMQSPQMLVVDGMVRRWMTVREAAETAIATFAQEEWLTARVMPEQSIRVLAERLGKMRRLDYEIVAANPVPGERQREPLYGPDETEMDTDPPLDGFIAIRSPLPITASAVCARVSYSERDLP